MQRKSPLFRKVNTTAHRPNVHVGGEYRDQRNTKREIESEAQRRPMHGKARKGLDYTPLFRFLLAKVGQPWREVHAEAVGRLDSEAPIYWLVALRENERQDYVRVGESSYYSGLFVDEAGLLQVVNPAIGPASLTPFCKCCTHTFNGVRFSRMYSSLEAE